MVIKDTCSNIVHLISFLMGPWDNSKQFVYPNKIYNFASVLKNFFDLVNSWVEDPKEERGYMTSVIAWDSLWIPPVAPFLSRVFSHWILG